MNTRDMQRLINLVTEFEQHVSDGDDNGAVIQAAIELRRAAERERERLRGHAAQLTLAARYRNPVLTAPDADVIRQRLSA